MARQQTVRATIKNDPFSMVIPMHEDLPDEGASSAGPQEQESKRPPAFRRRKLTVNLRPDLIERVKNAAYWNPKLTITSIAEMGIFHAIEQIEKENDGPYPLRDDELHGGRPIR